MATNSVPVPSPLNLHSGNVAENWKRFKQQWELYVIAAGFERKPSRQRTAVLLSVIGQDALEVYHTLEWEEEGDQWKVDKVVDKLEKFCIPRKNILYETFKFNSRRQEEGEHIDSYVTALRRLADNCEFTDKNRSIRDQLVFGLYDPKIREKLLREQNPSLEKVLDIVRANEIAVQQAKEMQGATEEVHPVESEEANAVRKFTRKPQGSGKRRKCKYCHKDHEWGNKELCPAYGKTCRKCGAKNHFEGSSVCPEFTKTNQDHAKQVEDVQQVEYAYLNSLKSKGHKKKTKTLTVAETGKTITFQIDTGACVNVMCFEDYKGATGDTSGCKLKPTNLVIVSYGGRQIRALGQREIEMIVNGSVQLMEITVVKVKATPLLSLQTCEQLGIVKVLNCDQESVNLAQSVMGLTKQDVLRKYPALFQGLGRLPGKLSIRLKEGAKPVVHPPRKVPVALKEELKVILTQMERDGIIAKVEEPTDWVSSLLIKKGVNKLRVCLDPKHLNEAIKREHYPLPRIEEVATRLSDVKVFSVLDVKSGFWHVELEEESSKLTTFNTPFGRYRWLRMPFGISLAPEVWQRRMHEFVEDLNGIEVIADDFLVTGRGKTIEEATLDHDTNLENFLKKASKKNLKLNPAKMKIKMEEVRFIGHVLTRSGIKIDPRKVEAIERMPEPRSVEDVKRFLGMVQYLSKFLPKLSQVTEPLRALTTVNAEWKWEKNHQQCYNHVKRLVCNTPVLAYFDSRKEITIQADASQGGLGAVLMQEGRPVTLSSRTLSKTERNYAQIEKEMLAIVHACSKFDEYVYGKAGVTVETDHKPLETIFKKPMNSAPKRLQRMLLFLHNYDLKVKYKPGKEMYIADALSRAYLPDSKPESLEVMQLGESEREVAEDCESMNLMGSNVTRSWVELQEATKTDPALNTVIHLIQNGWPENRNNVAEEAKPYFESRSELTIEDGIVFKMHRIVIPAQLRRKYLGEIHQSHIGTENCLRRAREYMYWPNMNAQVKDFIARCDVCNSMRREQQKESMLSYEIPARAWQTISTDIFQYRGLNYLVVVDHYSSFVECDRIFSLEPDCVISLLKKLFARYGIPEKVISDCGTQYTSRKFKDFATEWKFDHVTSSPRYPQSNGKAENAVKIVKGLLKKATEGKGDFYMALLDWRNTPTPDSELSPCQRMFGRRTRSSLPAHPFLLHQEGGESVKGKLNEAKEKQKYYYERGTRDLKDLEMGDSIRMKLPGRQIWEKGVVVGKLGNRSYKVKVQGSFYIRNRRQLLSVEEQSTETGEDCIPGNRVEHSHGNNQPMPTLRRSTRTKRRPRYHPENL